MANVERFYAAVGVVEDMEETAEVFEAMAPKYFKGLQVIIWAFKKYRFFLSVLKSYVDLIRVTESNGY